MDNVNFVFVKCPNQACGKVLKFKAVPNFREGILTCTHCGLKYRVKDAKILNPPAEQPAAPKESTGPVAGGNTDMSEKTELVNDKTKIIAARARVRCIDDGKEYELVPGVNTLGRAASKPKATLTFDDPDMYMSRLHATITFVTAPQPALHLKDEGSANGTFINNARIPAGSIVKLMPGTRFKMGNLEFECKLILAPGAARPGGFDDDPTELT